MNSDTPDRQVRAFHSNTTITVYQAYSPAIADAALRAGTFAPPFKRERMTWIKPSFRWMAYRCGWAEKPGQERVLAIEISRCGFLWALEHAALSHFDPKYHSDENAWSTQVRQTPVRVQWDPERDLHHRPLVHRSIQIGLRGEAVDRYVDEWIVGLRDVTTTMRDVHSHVRAGDLTSATELLPSEKPLPLPQHIADSIGYNGP